VVELEEYVQVSSMVLTVLGTRQVVNFCDLVRFFMWDNVDVCDDQVGIAFTPYVMCCA